MTTKYTLLTAAAAVAFTGSVPAFGQSSGAFIDNGDIVVTARKREESIMNVPVVTNAISQQQIEQTQITDIRRVAEQIPGFIVGEGSSAAYGAQLSLRGIGTSVLNGTIDQSISLNLDNQQFTPGSGLYRRHVRSAADHRAERAAGAVLRQGQSRAVSSPSARPIRHRVSS